LSPLPGGGHPRDFHTSPAGAPRSSKIHFGDGSNGRGIGVWPAGRSGRTGQGAGTGERISSAIPPFLLTYGDIWCPPETYPQMLRRFGEGDFAGVITVTRGRRCDQGRPDFFERTILPEAAGGKTVAGTVGAIAPRTAGSSPMIVWYNAGIYIFCPSLFDFTAGCKSPRR